MDIRKKQLQSAIYFSEAMLSDAEAGNWDKVMDIEIKRSELLTNLFSTPIDKLNVVEVDDEIRKIIDINAKLEAIAINSRDESGRQIASINKGRHAVNIYAKNSN